MVALVENLLGIACPSGYEYLRYVVGAVLALWFIDMVAGGLFSFVGSLVGGRRR